MNQQLPKSEHFHLRELTDGVYAALARPEGLAACNGGIIDLGNRTAVVDTFLSPEAATDLQTAAEELTGKPVDLVLLTHHHFDHIWGNQAFDDKTCIFSSEETYRAIEETGEESLKQNRENAARMLAEQQQKLASETDEDQRAEMSTAIRMIERRLALIDRIKLRLPSLTCQGPLCFFGTRRRAEFIPYEKGHSPGNSVINLPQDGIVFVGDLLFARRHPFMGDGDPQGWIRALEQIAALKPETVVPGHGPLSSVEDVRQMADYMQVISQKVQEFVQAGMPAAALRQIILPEPYASWEPKDLLMRSLDSLYQWYSA